MSDTQFTPGPWTYVYEEDASNMWHSVYGADEGGDGGLLVARCDQNGKHEDDARLIAAAPDLYNGCNAMLGLVQLILGRDDLSDELREVLTTNHRIVEAEAATAKARGETAA